MQKRIAFMARLNERLSIVEEALNKIGKLDELKQRLLTLEKNLYLSKKVLTFEEACSYMGISESLLYKLTAAKEVPHYKPRGKMLYFDKEELDSWLLQNKEPYKSVNKANRLTDSYHNEQGAQVKMKSRWRVVWSKFSTMPSLRQPTPTRFPLKSSGWIIQR